MHFQNDIWFFNAYTINILSMIITVGRYIVVCICGMKDVNMTRSSRTHFTFKKHMYLYIYVYGIIFLNILNNFHINVS